jgi:D-galactarolactone cycloisomerase
MKITNIETFHLFVRTEDAFYSSQGRFADRKSLLVRVETDTGLVGWGEGGQYGPADPVISCIENVFAPDLIGLELGAPQMLWERSFSRIRDFGTRGPYMEAISALDIAFWDLTGQEFGVPVHRLIGGARREAVHAYGTGFYYPADDPFTVDEKRLRKECDRKLSDGFDAVKVKIGLLPIKDDAKRMSIIRDHLGESVSLLVDCNHSYNSSSALQMASVLADFGVLWFEEPVIPEDKAAYKRVREASPVPVAGGECEYTRFGFNELIAGGCVDIAQPDLGVAGGISEWMQIQALAGVSGVSVIPHVWGSGVALAAALHVLAATPLNPFSAHPVPFQNAPVLEFDTTPNPLRSEVITEPFGLVDGAVRIPDAPGLGVTVDEDAVRRYAR